MTVDYIYFCDLQWVYNFVAKPVPIKREDPHKEAIVMLYL